MKKGGGCLRHEKDPVGAGALLKGLQLCLVYYLEKGSLLFDS